VRNNSAATRIPLQAQGFQLSEFAQIACAAPEVIEAHLMDGPCHFRLEAVAENLEAWQAFAKRLLARADLVSRVERRAIFRACNAQSF